MDGKRDHDDVLLVADNDERHRDVIPALVEEQFSGSAFCPKIAEALQRVCACVAGHGDARAEWRGLRKDGSAAASIPSIRESVRAKALGSHSDFDIWRQGETLSAELCLIQRDGSSKAGAAGSGS